MIKWNKVTEDKKVDLLIAIIASTITLISALLVYFK